MVHEKHQSALAARIRQ